MSPTERRRIFMDNPIDAGKSPDMCRLVLWSARLGDRTVGFKGAPEPSRTGRGLALCLTEEALTAGTFQENLPSRIAR